MKEDFSYQNKPKEKIRLGNLEVLQDSLILWDHQNQKLKYDWLELSGRKAPTFKMLLKNNVLGPTSKFIGVDISEEVTEECKKIYQEYDNLCSWYQEYLENIIIYQGDKLNNVGVLVFDSFNNFKGNPIKQELDIISRFALKQYENIGEFLLIINVAQRGSDKDIPEYCQMISEYLNGIHIPLECVEKYISTGKKISMLNLRILLK